MRGATHVTHCALRDAHRFCGGMFCTERCGLKWLKMWLKIKIASVATPPFTSPVPLGDAWLQGVDAVVMAVMAAVVMAVMEGPGCRPLG